MKCKILKDSAAGLSSGEYDHLIKIVIIGAPGAGKTSLMLRFIENHYDESYISTIGVDFKLKTIRVGDSILKLQVWDTAGQERFRSITRSYYRNSHGCLAMFDLTDRNSFLCVEEMINEFKNSGLADQSENILLVGAKKDNDASRQVNRTDAIRLANKHGVPYFEVSSKVNTGVEQVFFEIAFNAVRELQKSFSKTGVNTTADRRGTTKLERNPTKIFMEGGGEGPYGGKPKKQGGCC